MIGTSEIPDKGYEDYARRFDISAGNVELFGGGAALFLAKEFEILFESPANCSKSTSSCAKIISKAYEYPRFRAFCCRKTRRSCTESMIPIFDNMIPPDMLKNPAINPNNRHSYDFVNGARLVIGGLDEVSRTLSTNYDLLWVQEATEITEGEWEYMHRALRNHGIPDEGKRDSRGRPVYWVQAIAECNPDAPNHWLNVRANQGKMRRIRASHADNPVITEKDLEILRNMSGVRRQRLYEGLWVAAEGLVWPEFRTERHVLPRLRQDRDYRYFGAIDWGYAAPGCMQVWAVDKFDIMYRVAEVYRAEVDDEQWADYALELQKEFPVEYWIADHADAKAIGYFQRRRIPTFKAVKEVEHGLDVVRARLKGGMPDGSPRMYFIHIDKARRFGKCEVCERNKWPTCFEEEVWSYVYKPYDPDKAIDEKPDPRKFDHACFVAGTRILMADGTEKNIEDVKEGDQVMTPTGAGKVTASAMTGINMDLWECMGLVGTGNHPILTHRGHVPLDSLRYGDTIWVWKPAYMAASHTEDIQTPSDSTTVNISKVGFPATRGHTTCTGAYGWITTDGFHKDTTSTTLTGTQGTTTSQTWNASPPKNTPTDIRLRRSVAKFFVETWTSIVARLQSGIRRLLGSSGTERTPEPTNSVITEAQGVAKNVEKPTSLVVKGSDTAISIASSVREMRQASITWTGFASDANWFSVPTSILPKDIVRAGVVQRSRRLKERGDVYNLTVEPQHTYFANGILVSNCDTTRYAAVHLDPRNMKPLKVKPKYHPNSFAAIEGYEEIMRRSRAGEYEGRMLEARAEQDAEELWG